MVKMADNLRGQVFYVDDESAVCAVVKETLEQSEIKTCCFIHPNDCLAELRRKRCDLVIADLKMPEKSGIELLGEVKELAPWIPVLIVAACGDIPTVVKAIKGGAVDFIEKPLGKDNFVQKVKVLVERSRAVPFCCFRALTRMEKTVLRMAVTGATNKEIARAVSRAVRTVEGHRTRLMHKLGVHNIVDLVKLASEVGLVDLTASAGTERDNEQTHDHAGEVRCTGS